MTRSKTIGIHQPNYLPWLGYFYKISCCDIFIFHDNVELTKKGYTRRTFIRKANSPEKIYLTVPLQKHSDYALIKDLQISNDKEWRIKHLNRLYGAYHSAPNLLKYHQLIKEEIHLNTTSLATLNISLIKKISARLNLNTEFYLSSELPVTGKGSEYNLNLCKHFEATHYASGKGAKNYQDESAFQKEGIEIVYNDFFSYLKTNPYDQHRENFIPGLSIMDALYNIGAEGVNELFKNYHLT